MKLFVTSVVMISAGVLMIQAALNRDWTQFMSALTSFVLAQVVSVAFRRQPSR